MMEIAPPPRSKRTSLPRQVSTPVIRRPPNKPPKPPAGCAAAASIREQQPPPVINHRNHNNKNCQQQQSVGGVNQILINSSLVRTTTNTTTSEDEDHIYERKLLTLRNRRTSLKIIFRAMISQKSGNRTPNQPVDFFSIWHSEIQIPEAGQKTGNRTTRENFVGKSTSTSE